MRNLAKGKNLGKPLWLGGRKSRRNAQLPQAGTGRNQLKGRCRVCGNVRRLLKQIFRPRLK